VTAQAVDAALADAFGQTAPEGVILLEMHPDSPLAKAGLLRGDVVLSVDGAAVNSAAEMMFRLSVSGLGAQSDVTYRRGDHVTTTQIDLIAAPDTPDRQARYVDGRSALRGLSVARINPAVISEYNLAPEAGGVIVTGLAEFAARTGLRKGDIVLAINGAAITSTDDVVQMAREQTRTWLIEVLREGRRVALRFRL
jgi:S1-C subfamily serine protease